MRKSPTLFRFQAVTTAALLTFAGTSTAETVMGFIYVGPKDDYGYNQAHAEGGAGVSKLPDVKVVEEASVPETNAVQETMLNMVNIDGASVLFPTSFGYFDPHILKVAKEAPEVQFLHCGGLYDEKKHPKNVGSYFGWIYEAQYINGIVAGHASKSGKLGFIAAKPIPQVLMNINAFALGARKANPKATVKVVFTGDWAMPVKEAEAANSLIDQGIDVLTCHVDSPKVVTQTAERRGAFVCGYHANGAALAPKGYLTGAEWDWSSVYSKYAKMIQEGKTLMNGGIPHLVRGGFKEGFIKMSPYGPAVSAAAKVDADAAKAAFQAGTLEIFTGELKDNEGKVQVAAGGVLKRDDPAIESMSWLVEGVLGSTK
ncbi:MAG: BMP family ABC transporter substrate-binding protein [Verrucomicrobium sp.]